MAHLRPTAAVATLMAAYLLAGCSATLHEKHYFATFSEKTPGVREASQFFRVTVDGQASFANVRYLTGYFDERAVSLFFNEIKAPDLHRLFPADQKLPGTDIKLTPLNAPDGEGSFVLIMSTNADTIANTIGSFAESQVVADALTRAINRDRFREKASSDAIAPVLKAHGTALAARVQAHLDAAAVAPTGTAAAAANRRALTALAQTLGYSGPEFATVTAARDWFGLESATGAVGGQR
jgi:hypothetical protein